MFDDLYLLLFKKKKYFLLPVSLLFAGRVYIHTCSRKISFHVGILHCCTTKFYFDLSLRLIKQDQRGCPSSSIIVQLALYLLPLPKCHWGSHSLATAFLVHQAPCPRRAPASPSGALLYLQAQPLPIVQPQVLFI